MLSGFGRSRREAEQDRQVAVPRPAGRAVVCPDCGAHFEVSIKAINARCPKCTRPMRFEDAELNGLCTQNVTTMGAVRVGRKGVVRGRIICGQLVVTGQLDGNVRITGCCVVQPGGVLRGEVAARAIHIQRGGTFEGSLEISTGATEAKPAA
ncbi:MAG: polymer-forming cytoskeletal protein [Phycisphaerales bacterium]|nr:polymer-forming cytoskeletal protein [Phycisphaerales bacterium]